MRDPGYVNPDICMGSSFVDYNDANIPSMAASTRDVKRQEVILGTCQSCNEDFSGNVHNLSKVFLAARIYMDPRKAES